MSDRERTPTDVVYGLHPVEELISARPAEIERLWVAREKSHGVGPLVKRARHAGVPISYVPREVLRRKLALPRSFQGIAAEVALRAYDDAQALLGRAAADPQGMLLLLDRVTDVGNVGALMRTAAAVGCAGAVLGEGVPGLSAGVAKASAGAVERLAVSRVARPGRFLEVAGEAGFRGILLDPGGGEPWDRCDLTGRIIVVAGGEQRGAGSATAKGCRQRVRIPLAAEVESLNVGVAAGVLLFEALRQRRAPETP